MTCEKHDISHDFPDLKDKIHALRQSDAYFARLYSAYGPIDADICKIEEGILAVSDETLHLLKVHRSQLKDAIYSMLVPEETGGCCGGCGCKG